MSKTVVRWAPPTTQQRQQQAQLKQKKKRLLKQIFLMMVLDLTYSMDPYLQAVRAMLLHMIEQINDAGFDVEVALTIFRDENFDEEPVFYPAGTPVETIVKVLKKERVIGGGDIPESSLPAIAKTLRLPAPHGAQPVVLHITDAPCHEPEQGHDRHTVLQQLKAMQAIFFACTPEIEPYTTLVNGTGGTLFPIKEEMEQKTFEQILKQFVATTIHTVMRLQPQQQVYGGITEDDDI